MDTVQTLAYLALYPWKARVASRSAPAGEDTDRTLGAALERACRQAWKALAVVLAGDAFWEGSKLFLPVEEHRILAEQVAQLRRELLAVLPPEKWEEHRTACWRELQWVRQAGWLPDEGLEDPKRLAEVLTCLLASTASQTQEATQIQLLVEQLHAVGLVETSRLLHATPPGQLPLLVRAARCWLYQYRLARREQDEGPSYDEKTEPALTRLLQALAHYGPGLQEWLVEETTAAPVQQLSRSAAAAMRKSTSPAPLAGGWSAASASEREAAPLATGKPETVLPTAPSTAQQRFWGVLLSLLVLTIPVVLVLWLMYRYSLQEVRQFQGHTGTVVRARFSPDGRYVLSASTDRTLRLWEVATGEEVRRLTGHTGDIAALDLSADGRRAASGGTDSLRLWDLTTGQELWHLSAPKKGILSLALSPDGKRLCTASRGEHLIRVWDAEDRRLLQTLVGHAGEIQAVAYSPDGAWLVSAGDKTLRLWSISQGQEVRRFQGHEKTVTCLAFSADGRWLASGSQDGTVRLWDVASGQELERYFPAAPVSSVALSPDGRLLAAGTFSHAGRPETSLRAPQRSYCLRLWRRGSDAEAAYPDISEDMGAIWSVAFSPDGRYFLSAGEDKKIHLWQTP